ncbi:2-oxo acid dehydrogenase subunit E2 [Acaricomes phytoseiuli]|uniref:dihydrolipoamide acetyltransferase family protein n=1 Tax=Acaricomes phytoseiuli TaxID=291968 RepID=UPI002222319A|nr:dihydrolipoamide acetyltransferase family protein [Acaricomes phytoseiuli]MCW1250023.1 2-oxo acid dehydrogenase subunit E2 [Acaricomes phytoseiuli]
MRDFKLPDVGEGLTEAEIVSWKVAAGETVAVNQVLVEIETAKSLVELPSPHSGKVSALLVDEGQTVDVGTPIIAFEDSEAPGTRPEPSVPSHPAIPATGEQLRAEDPEVAVPHQENAAAAAPLVGAGPKADAVQRRRRRTGAAAAPAEAVRTNALPAKPGSTVLATPPVRKAAKDLGIDLAEVSATGSRGEVTRRDVLDFHTRRGATPGKAFWSEDSRIERIPVRGVRKATARAMVDSAFSAPHVSIFVDVDASRTMEFVKRLKASREFEGIRVSPLLILAKAVIWAAARNPHVNASWSEEEILVKHFMNLGIAAATPRGLMVPNIKNAQDLTLKELAVALNELAERARAGKTPPSDMQGGTMTITNIGALGIDTGTPIINPGEVAIVAFGTIKQKPWVLDGEVIPRWITTLGGSFDHRVVDGDLSARFMADVASILEEPALLLD